jgi:DNA-directed RNA polymerase subunit M/transcription elongation factor TFIIS
MGMCPLCNGFEQIKISCPNCGKSMDDSGRIMDFYDDYSAYMEIDDLKREDGYKDTFSKGKCPHLMSCPHCGRNEVKFIQE